jgi:hypothetical protein
VQKNILVNFIKNLKMKKILPLFSLILLISFFTTAQTCINPTGGTINGDVNGCVDRVGTYTVTGVSNATTYNWVIIGAVASKVNDTQYSIVFSNPGTVTITVTPINQTNGPCSGTPITKTITVSNTPNRPIITQTGATLSTSAGAASYQWYVGSTLITSATSQTYAPTQNGQYRVEIKNGAICNIFSDPFNYTVTAIKEDQKFDNFSFYPNPVMTTIHVNFVKKFDIEFYNLNGQKVLQKANLQGEQEIDMSNLNKGIYIMRIKSEGKYAARKIILQ